MNKYPILFFNPRDGRGVVYLRVLFSRLQDQNLFPDAVLQMLQERSVTADVDKDWRRWDFDFPSPLERVQFQSAIVDLMDQPICFCQWLSPEHAQQFAQQITALSPPTSNG